MSTNPQPRYADTDRTRTTSETTTEITARGGEDRWAAADTAEQRIAPMAAPYTFDPFCTKRLRNCTDAENAAMPSPETDTE